MGERLSVPQRLVRKLPTGARVGLAGLGLIGGLGGVACGSGRGGEQVQPPAAPAQAAELSTPTAVATEAVPTVVPTESPKPTATQEAIPVSVIPDKLDEISAPVNSLSEPLNPRVSKDAFLGLKKQIDIELQAAKEAFAKGDVETSRTNLLKARTDIVALGDPLEMVFIPKELKEKHDPNDKYIQKERVDPRTRDWYLGVIDLLVSTDSTYAVGK